MALFYNWCLFWVKTFQATPVKEILVPDQGVLSTISEVHPSLFYMVVPPCERSQSIKEISISYQMATSEIGNYLHARFVKILLIYLKELLEF